MTELTCWNDFFQDSELAESRALNRSAQRWPWLYLIILN